MPLHWHVIDIAFSSFNEYALVLYQTVIRSGVLCTYPRDSVSLFGCWWFSPAYLFLLWYESSEDGGFHLFSL